MKVSDYIAEYLADRKVPAVFELAGGMITFLIDSIYQHGKTQLVSMHHEQAAAFAAEGVARISGIPGVAMATSGPGATNLVTGIGSCYFDSTPAVFITGQVNRNERRGGSAVRQLGFQETDIARMVGPIVKKVWEVDAPEQIQAILDDAFHIAASDRPGPVLIDIPMDVQRAQMSPAPLSKTGAETELTALLMRESEAIFIRNSILSSRKPLILVGGGIRAAKAVEELRRLAEVAQIPVVHSLMAVDVLPWDHSLNAGMIGSYGNRWSNVALSESDCLLVLGSRLDVRQTGSDVHNFVRGRKIFQIDCDSAEINNRVKGCHGVIAHLRSAITILANVFALTEGHSDGNWQEWARYISSLREQWSDVEELKNIEGINPNRFMHQLSQASRDAAAYVVDVGQHQMWAAQSLEVTGHQRFLTSGGMGSMGFSLPAAIGVAVGLPGQQVVVIAGDGSFQCNIQELQTAIRMALPLKIIVINNQSLGMVRQFQQSYFGGRYRSTVWGYSAPDFAAVAHGYGIPSRSVNAGTDVDEALCWMNTISDGPSLLEVHVSPSANAYPKLAFGKGMAAMEPTVLSNEMEGT